MIGKRPVQLIGAPMDLGAGRRGVDMGPSALRIAGVAEALRELGWSVHDGGNVPVPQRETLEPGDDRLRYAEPIAGVCADVALRTREAVEDGALPVVLGGDHSVALGSISGVVAGARQRGERVGVVWLDAHGDMNTERTSPSGNVHGMPLACLLGDGDDRLCPVGDQGPVLAASDVALIGLRAIDSEEARVIRASGVGVYTMRDLDERGLRAVVSEALAVLVRRCDRLHVSFDVDFVDPSIAPGVGTRVRGGPTYREAHLCMELLADTGLVGSLDVVELNPTLDCENRTAELSVDLIASLFGKQIL